MHKVELFNLGLRSVYYEGSGHWLWLSSFGWHDCSQQEDKLLNTRFHKTTK